MLSPYADDTTIYASNEDPSLVGKHLEKDLGALGMAVASGPAGPVLAGPVFTATFETAHAQIIQHVWGPSYIQPVVDAHVYATHTFCDEL